MSRSLTALQQSCTLHPLTVRKRKRPPKSVLHTQAQCCTAPRRHETGEHIHTYIHTESVRAPRAARSTTRDCSRTSLCCSRLSNAQCFLMRACRPTSLTVMSTRPFFVFSSESLSASCLRSWDEGHGEGGWACAWATAVIGIPIGVVLGRYALQEPIPFLFFFCLLSSFSFFPICFYLSFCISVRLLVSCDLCLFIDASLSWPVLGEDPARIVRCSSSRRIEPFIASL